MSFVRHPARGAPAIARNTKKTRPAGFEPATYGLGNRDSDSVTAECTNVNDIDVTRLADELTDLILRHADLDRVIIAWPALSADVRERIGVLIGDSKTSAD